MNRFLFVAASLILIVAMSANTQGSIFTPHQNPAAASSDKPNRSADSIEGRVVSDDGQPVMKARIAVRGTGVSREIIRRTGTDEEGRFKVGGLEFKPYYVQVTAPGYLTSNESAHPRPYRPGDFVNFTMTKGGVITGTVTDSSGKPVVAVPVGIVQVRDSNGRVVNNSRISGSKLTDDRGIYRIYGLTGGSYLVVAGAYSGSYPDMAARFANHTPTYFPSSTRQTATEVKVGRGEEATGIDIRYRGERGHSIIGRVSGAFPSDVRSGHVALTLLQAASSSIEATTTVSARDTERAFAFYNLPDGEYDLIAQSHFTSGEGGFASPLRVKVSGADIAGIEVKLAPYSSIEGRLFLEPLQDAALKSECKDEREFSLREAGVIARPESRREHIDRPPLPDQPRAVAVAPKDTGEFAFAKLHAERYRIEAHVPSRFWYLRSITLLGTGRNRRPVDATRNGIALRSGERVEGLSINIAEGAASLTGRVVHSVEGSNLPDRLRVHLVPADKDRADDALRFVEVPVRPDGSFSMVHLAPGRYRLVARQAPEEAESFYRPMAWDAEGRETLRRMAEAVDSIIELQPCRHVSEHKLLYAPASK